MFFVFSTIFFKSKNPLKSFFESKKIFLSIVWWLSGEVCYSYWVASQNKFMKAKLQFAEFFFQLNK